MNLVITFDEDKTMRGMAYALRELANQFDKRITPNLDEQWILTDQNNKGIGRIQYEYETVSDEDIDDNSLYSVDSPNDAKDCDLSDPTKYIAKDNNGYYWVMRR